MTRLNIYLNCHVNSRGGDRGEIFYDYRSSAGPVLAGRVAAALQRQVGWSVFPKPCRPDTNGVPRDGNYSEAYSCISGVIAPALCIEPYFLDGPKAEIFFSNLVGVVEGLAQGIDEWLKM